MPTFDFRAAGPDITHWSGYVEFLDGRGRPFPVAPPRVPRRDDRHRANGLRRSEERLSFERGGRHKRDNHKHLRHPGKRHEAESWPDEGRVWSIRFGALRARKEHRPSQRAEGSPERLPSHRSVSLGSTCPTGLLR